MAEAKKTAPATGTDVAVQQPQAAGVVIGKGQGAGVTIGGKVFKVTKKVTLPLLKHGDGEQVAIRIDSPIYVGKEIKAGRDGQPKEKPADLANIINLETGEEMVYIMSAVVKGNLEDTYPNASYVGKSFAIAKGATVEGKRYKEYAVVEIEPQD